MRTAPPSAAWRALAERPTGGGAARAPVDGRPAGRAGPPLAIRCAVGPEGGFSPAEEALFREHGFHAAGLPGGILRVDTAAVAALTVAGQLLTALGAHERPEHATRGGASGPGAL